MRQLTDPPKHRLSQCPCSNRPRPPQLPQSPTRLGLTFSPTSPLAWRPSAALGVQAWHPLLLTIPRFPRRQFPRRACQFWSPWREALSQRASVRPDGRRARRYRCSGHPLDHPRSCRTKRRLDCWASRCYSRTPDYSDQRDFRGRSLGMSSMAFSIGCVRTDQLLLWRFRPVR